MAQWLYNRMFFENLIAEVIDGLDDGDIVFPGSDQHEVLKISIVCEEVSMSVVASLMVKLRVPCSNVVFGPVKKLLLATHEEQFGVSFLVPKESWPDFLADREPWS